MNRLLLAWSLCLGALALALTAGTMVSGSPLASSEQLCIEAGLARPQVVEAVMSHPGDHYTQTAIAEFHFRELPTECQEEFRVGQPRYQFQLQDHLHRAHWISLNPLRPLWPSPRKHGNLFAHWGIQRGHGLLQPIARRRLYQCSPGKAITKVRVLMKQAVLSLESHAVVGSEAIAVPVKVLRVQVPLKHRGALRGPC